MRQQGHKTEGANRMKTMRFHPFVFTGKEKDEETGFGYFGARYMDHVLMTGRLRLRCLQREPCCSGHPCILRHLGREDPQAGDQRSSARRPSDEMRKPDVAYRPRERRD